MCEAVELMMGRGSERHVPPWSTRAIIISLLTPTWELRLPGLFINWDKLEMWQNGDKLI